MNQIQLFGVLGVWTGLLSGFFIFIVKAIVGAEIKKINGTYRRTPECTLIMQPIVEKLNHIEEKVDDLDTYTHERVHELAEQIGINLIKKRIGES